jgi:hypothetical protein
MTSEEALVVAIGNALREAGHLREGDILGDWHLMCEITSLDPDSRGKTKYVNVIPGENGVPMHRVLGLIRVCCDMLKENRSDE